MGGVKRYRPDPLSGFPAEHVVSWYLQLSAPSGSDHPLSLGIHAGDEQGPIWSLGLALPGTLCKATLTPELPTQLAKVKLGLGHSSSFSANMASSPFPAQALDPNK